MPLPLRDFLGIEKDVKLFVHNRLSDEQVANLANSMGIKCCNVDKDQTYEDAKVLVDHNDCIVYRYDNEIYFIPAKRKELPVAVSMDNDNNKITVHVVYEYPCEMKREDLVEY